MRWLKYLGVAAMLMSVAGFSYGVWGIYDQHRQITTAHSIEAVALGGRIETRDTQYTRSYEPIIDYRFVIDGETYESDQTTPAGESGPQSWANDVLRKYPAGARVQAWVNPNDPSESFLLPRYDSTPYTSVLFGVLIAAAGLMTLREYRTHFAAPPQPQQLTAGGVRLPAAQDYDRAWLFFVTIGIVWTLAGAPAWLHFLWVSQPPIDVLFIVYAVAYNVVGLGFVAYGCYAFLSSNRFGDTEVRLDRVQLCVGQNFTATVEQDSEFDGTIRSMQIRLVGKVKRKQWVANTVIDDDEILYEQTQRQLEGHSVSHQSRIRGIFEFTIPAGLPPTTPTSDHTNERVVWVLELTTDAGPISKYKNEYVLAIQPEQSL